MFSVCRHCISIGILVHDWLHVHVAQVGVRQVIAGWDIGILGDGDTIPPMKQGGKRTLIIPSGQKKLCDTSHVQTGLQSTSSTSHNHFQRSFGSPMSLTDNLGTEPQNIIFMQT